ncbi:MAG: transcriptional regulator GlxA family with amidase domain [Limisphaerales bacterium]|jgi:transcriptional regulator GlxA family with amidase domain
MRERKLDKAAKLLTNTSLRISDIAFDVGFLDIPNFSRLFQKTYGKAPSAYRFAN